MAESSSKSKVIRGVLLGVGFVALAAAAAWAWLRQQQTTTLNVNDTDFAVVDTASVDRIFIAHKDGQTALFERREGGEWWVGDRYPAAAPKMRMLLGTLHDVSIKRALNPAERDNVVREMAVHSAKVEIYQRGELSKVYYVGNETNDERGSYFLMDGAEQPYAVHIRGFRGQLTSRFRVRPSDWREKTLFVAARDQLEEVAVGYPNAPKDGFTIVRDGRRLVVEQMPGADTARVRAYAGLFARGVYAERYYDEGEYVVEYLDSLRAATPAALLRMQRRGRAPVEIELYELAGQSDRMIALMGEKREPLTIQLPILNQLLMRRPFFGQGPPVTPPVQ
ncbi:MAG: DUF4340 domain-containing protein [Catalinimonas sp.]